MLQYVLWYNICEYLWLVFLLLWIHEKLSLFSKSIPSDLQVPVHKDVTRKRVFQKASLLSALWQTFKVALIKVTILKVAADFFSFLSPQIMK